MYKKIYYFGFVIACAFVVYLFISAFNRIMKQHKRDDIRIETGIPTSEETYTFDPCCPCLEHGEEAVMIVDGSYFCTKCIE